MIDGENRAPKQQDGFQHKLVQLSDLENDIVTETVDIAGRQMRRWDADELQYPSEPNQDRKRKQIQEHKASSDINGIERGNTQKNIGHKRPKKERIDHTSNHEALVQSEHFEHSDRNSPLEPRKEEKVDSGARIDKAYPDENGSYRK